jgi:hypothetical protein
MESVPKIIKFEVREPHILLVEFENHVIKKLDLGPRLPEDRFAGLADPACFARVTLDPGGYGLSWDDYADLSEYEVWTSGTPVDQGNPCSG